MTLVRNPKPYAQELSSGRSILPEQQLDITVTAYEQALIDDGKLEQLAGGTPPPAPATRDFLVIAKSAQPFTVDLSDVTDPESDSRVIDVSGRPRDVGSGGGIPAWAPNTTIGPSQALKAPDGSVIVHGPAARTSRPSFDSTEAAFFQRLGVATDDLQAAIDANTQAIALLQATVETISGAGLLFGDGPPAPTVGRDGQSYVDLTNKRLYVGKGRTMAGAWPGAFLAFDIGDVTAPSQVTGVTAAVVSGQAAVDVAWSAATDNVGVAAYVIYRDGAQIATVQSPTVTYRDTTPGAGATYAYTVRAFDASGNGGTISTAASATVPAQSGSGGSTTADDFNAPDGTSLATRSTPLGNRAWAVSSGGVFATENGVARCSTGSNVVAKVNDGHADVRVKATFTAGIAGNIAAGLACRIVDDLNYFYARPGADGKWYLARRNAGNASAASTTTGTNTNNQITAANGDVVELEPVGNTLSLYVNGALAQRITNVTGMNATSTTHGLYGHATAGGSARYENFSITPVS